MEYKQKLFERTKVKLGHPIRNVELTDEMLETLLQEAEETSQALCVNKSDSVRKVFLTQYFHALCKESLGMVRGKFKGDIGIPNSDLKLEYELLIKEGSSERINLIEMMLNE